MPNLIPDGCDSCPNHHSRRDGFTLFGSRIDPLEAVLHLAIVVILGVPAARASTEPDFTWRNGIEWLGAIVVASTVVRLSPTQRINAYLQVTGRDR